MSQIKTGITPWGSLYQAVQIEEEKAKEEGKELVVHRDPLDPQSPTLSEAEKAYFKARMRCWELLEERRTYKTFQNILYKQRKRKEDRVDRVFTSDVPYIFLQYIGVLLQWGQQRHEVAQNELLMLLYVYPIGIFDKVEWNMMAEVIGLKSFQTTTRMLTGLIKKNMIRVWYKQKKGDDVPTQYCLTEKAKDMCSKMHTMALGKTKIPLTHRNPLSTYRESNFNKIFEKMNERVKKKETANE